MITVLVRVTHGPEALAATLSALVPAVAEGLVGDAVILADRQDDILAKVADAAGATLILAEPGSWIDGARVARRDWLLCLDDGDIPQEGWIRVLDRFVALSKPEQGLARMRRRRAGVMSGALTNLFAGSKVRGGDLVHRRVLMNEVRASMPVRLSATIERDPLFG
ncbi:hypothetical protein VB618_00470 [Microvirga sp. CF3062]|uniref:hypothetical protein n=1 Tax=Microvirga sp. CF3062 TaxID=3110182 RepID=UPI002E7A953B|nr:hypothetical protein [Microvirga sp. CF3062]MEE1654653.1 hypothetical protein [Microvirga sp. CF3062]